MSISQISNNTNYPSVDLSNINDVSNLHSINKSKIAFDKTIDILSLADDAYSDGYIPEQLQNEFDVKPVLQNLISKFDTIDTKSDEASVAVQKQPFVFANASVSTDTYSVNALVMVMLYLLHYVIPNQLAAVNKMQEITVGMVTTFSKIFSLAAEIIVELANLQYNKACESARTEMIGSFVAAAIGTVSTVLELRGISKAEAEEIVKFSKHGDTMKQMQSELQTNEKILNSFKPKQGEKIELNVADTNNINDTKEFYNDKVTKYEKSAKETIDKMSSSTDRNRFFKTPRLKALDDHLKTVEDIEVDLKAGPHISKLKNENKALSTIEENFRDSGYTINVDESLPKAVSGRSIQDIANEMKQKGAISHVETPSQSPANNLQQKSEVYSIVKNGNDYCLGKIGDNGIEIYGKLNFNGDEATRFDTNYKNAVNNDLYCYKNRDAFNEFYSQLDAINNEKGKASSASSSSSSSAATRENISETNLNIIKQEKESINNRIKEGYKKYSQAQAEYDGLDSYIKKCNDYENAGNVMSAGGDLHKKVNEISTLINLSVKWHSALSAFALTVSRGTEGVVRGYAQQIAAAAQVFAAELNLRQTQSSTLLNQMEQIFNSMMGKSAQLNTSVFDMLQQALSVLQQSALVNNR